MQHAPTGNRILAVCNIDAMGGILLRPWLKGLQSAGYDVHIACAPGPYFQRLEQDGFETHAIAVKRRFNPLVNVKAVWQTFRLIRQNRYAIINTHSPTGAAVGRVAAWLSGASQVVYTVHGFYFHENMSVWQRAPLVAIEWLLGQVTDHFMFVSEEDRQTALHYGIARNASATTTIYNGVDRVRFSPATGPRCVDRQRWGLHPDRPVVGIVARIVREKGYREFLQMAETLVERGHDVSFLVVGDSLASDRDQFAAKFKQNVREAGLLERFVFTGSIEDVPGALQAMDIFVLPSYREGFPRSILEAMAVGLPVVATDIRGCREAVLDGRTGWIVPPRDAKALAGAVGRLLDNPELAGAAGAAGRDRVERYFDETEVQQRFVRVFQSLSSTADAGPADPAPMASRRQGWRDRAGLVAKRVLDIALSVLALAAALPLMLAVAAGVRISMGSPVLFRQRRPGWREEPFTLYKFRTMNTGSAPDSERLTPFGRFLRRTSLDELPQLWNVLRGQMSLVGPRPLLPEYLARYNPRQRRRQEVRPGITGWAQVNGRNALDWEDKLELDVWYVDHRSLLLDAGILLRTAWKVIGSRGISRQGHATMPEFLGSPSPSDGIKLNEPCQ